MFARFVERNFDDVLFWLQIGSSQVRDFFHIQRRTHAVILGFVDLQEPSKKFKGDENSMRNDSSGHSSAWIR
jgi:hypothetical protein